MRKAKRIMVGLKILENAVELTDLACRLGARGAELILIHVIELPDNTPLNTEVPNLEAEARKILRARASGSPQSFESKDPNSAGALCQFHTALRTERKEERSCCAWLPSRAHVR